ncbi:MAG: hypothetical protein ABJZ55_12435 [Fuerstiella sp.]
MSAATHGSGTGCKPFPIGSQRCRLSFLKMPRKQLRNAALFAIRENPLRLAASPLTDRIAGRELPGKTLASKSEGSPLLP